ncbi:MAG: HlyD family efflux transporter periplasmic adaptor subunit [Acidaminobacteraceae bacterium]
MTEISIDLSDITNSREVMESKPYPMVVYFVYILLSFITISSIWMYFSEIDVVVKGNGMVRPVSGISLVNNNFTGSISETNLYEGQNVKKGDLLFSIMHSDLKATQSLLRTELSQKEKVAANLGKYKESILTKTNLFDPEHSDQIDYYYKYIEFSDAIAVSKETISVNVADLKHFEITLAGMTSLLDSIEANENLFRDSNNLYALKLAEFNMKIQELNQNYTDATVNYKNSEELFNNGAISKKDFQNSFTARLQSKLTYEQYKTAYMSNLKSDIQDRKLQIRKLKSEINKLSSNLDSSKESYLTIETKKIVELNSQIVLNEQEIRSLEESLTKKELEIDKCLIVAEIDGIVNMKKQIAVGDYISAGDYIASIIPVENKEYKVQVSMPEKEISRIKVGDPIKYKFHALPYREYGVLNGVVTSISSDSTFSEQSGANYFVLEANVENKPLYSYKGERAELKVGMTCEVDVIIKSKKVIFFLLEKLDFLD